MEQPLVDHLFRHHYGKMVATLTRIFGLKHLQTIEDAIQDSFAVAIKKWQTKIPENPEAWLNTAAKNRVIDLLRKLKADDMRSSKLFSGKSAIAIDELFLPHEIEDSQLRMIFTACHPNDCLEFKMPIGNELSKRLERVLEIIYLIFNEGFHSSRQDILIRKELCGEALRLIKLVLCKDSLRSGTAYAILSLMCLHASRLDSKTDSNGNVIDISKQDRTLWYKPMIDLGRTALLKTEDYDDLSSFHIEAAIAAEHVKADSFEQTDWNKILSYYDSLYDMNPSAFTKLNKSIVLMQLKRNKEAYDLMMEVDPNKLDKRQYLYYGAKASYFNLEGDLFKAINEYDKALKTVLNEAEKKFIQTKKENLIRKLN